MELSLFSLAITLMLCAGSGLVLLLVPRRHSLSLTELYGLSILLGMALVSAASFICGWFLNGVRLRILVSSICLLLLLVGWFRARRNDVCLRRAERPAQAELVLIAMLLSELIGITWLSLHVPLGWDGFFNWGAKTRIAVMSGGLFPPALFTSDSLRFSHPEYPPLVPLTEAWLHGWIGQYHQGMAKLFPPLLFLAAGCFLLNASARYGTRSWHKWLPAVLLPCVPLIIIRDGSLTSGYADFPLALCYLAAVHYLIAYAETGSGAAIRFLGGLCLVLPLIKQEGTILWLTIVLLASLTILRNRQWRHLWLVLLPGAFTASGWLLTMHWLAAPVGQDFQSFSRQTLADNLSRITTILPVFLAELTEWKRWGLLWPGLLLLPFGWQHNRRIGLSLLTASIALPVLTELGLYFFISTRTKSLAAHIDASLPRLLLHVAPLAVLLVSISITTGNAPPSHTDPHTESGSQQ